MDDGVVFDATSVAGSPIRKDAGYGGVGIDLRATRDGACLSLQIDIGFGDAVTPAALSIAYPTLLPDVPVPTCRTAASRRSDLHPPTDRHAQHPAHRPERCFCRRTIDDRVMGGLFRSSVRHDPAGHPAPSNRIITYYVHLDRIAAAVGDAVKRGEAIGTVGATGRKMPRSKTPHRHFEALIYPTDAPRFVLGWLRDFTTVSPAAFIGPELSSSSEVTFESSESGLPVVEEPHVGRLALPILCR